MEVNPVDLQVYLEKLMDKEKVGALIDGVYAIAMTLLVLEIPQPEPGIDLQKAVHQTSNSLVDYVLAFMILFAFWYNQRRINDLVISHRRTTLWLNALALMMVCLLPFSTTLLYNFGQRTSWLGDFNHSALVDIVFIAVCLSIDGLIHLNLAVIHHGQGYPEEHHKKVSQVVQSRRIATLILVLVMFISFALPIPNRVSLFVVPLLMVFEVETVNLVSQTWRRLRQ